MDVEELRLKLATLEEEKEDLTKETLELTRELESLKASLESSSQH